MARRTFSFVLRLAALILLFPVFYSCQAEKPLAQEEEKEPELPKNPDAANCYIISQPGTLQFRAYKGNSFLSVGEVASVEVLWESVGTETAPAKGSLIASVAYTPSEHEGEVGVISCTTGTKLRDGNAVIAAMDADGNILWSWHLWICENYDPEAREQVYYREAGVMMDRNLGAISTTPGNSGANGLLYQWGRKDPFLGSSSISAAQKAASSGREWSVTASSAGRGTIEYAIAHPMTFIAGNANNGDWKYGEDVRTDYSRWGTSKTIYDPCPPGWRVPDEAEALNNLWTNTLGGKDTFKFGHDLDNYGNNFFRKFGDSDPIWYPLAGYINGASSGVQALGQLVNTGKYGFWWACGGKSCLKLDYYSNNRIEPAYSSWIFHAYGHSVRCQKES